MPADNFVWIPEPAKGGLLVQKADKPQGESKDKWFSKNGAWECKSVAFGVEQAQTAGSATSGSAAGKAKFQPFKIEKDVDTASCPLFTACTAGAHYPTVILAVRKSGGTNFVYLEYIFRQVFVTEITWDGGGGEENPKETVTFAYGALGMQYIQQKADGTAGTLQQGLWSQIANKVSLEIPTATGSAPQFISTTDAQQV
ncbi:MAG: Hcp family type VI secretion system effector [Bryobacteraceae bacterium]